MNDREKKFRSSLKLDDDFLKECEKQMKEYNKNYEARKELAEEIALKDLRKQYQAEQDYEMLSELGPF